MAAGPVIDSPVNVAIPAMAVAVKVPLKLADPPLNATVTIAVAEEPVVTVKELASWIVT